jgi:hypothetical protein
VATPGPPVGAPGWARFARRGRGLADGLVLTFSAAPLEPAVLLRVAKRAPAAPRIRDGSTKPRRRVATPGPPVGAHDLPFLPEDDVGSCRAKKAQYRARWTQEWAQSEGANPATSSHGSSPSSTAWRHLSQGLWTTRQKLFPAHRPRCYRAGAVVRSGRRLIPLLGSVTEPVVQEIVGLASWPERGSARSARPPCERRRIVWWPVRPWWCPPVHSSLHHGTSKLTGYQATNPASSASDHHGALARPPRRPTQTALYQAVQGHLETFVARAAESDPMGYGLPEWVERDFRGYLECGVTSASLRRASGVPSRPSTHA